MFFYEILSLSGIISESTALLNYSACSLLIWQICVIPIRAKIQEPALKEVATVLKVFQVTSVKKVILHKILNGVIKQPYYHGFNFEPMGINLFGRFV